MHTGVAKRLAQRQVVSQHPMAKYMQRGRLPYTYTASLDSSHLHLPFPPEENDNAPSSEDTLVHTAQLERPFDDFQATETGILDEQALADAHVYTSQLERPFDDVPATETGILDEQALEDALRKSNGEQDTIEHAAGHSSDSVFDDTLVDADELGSTNCHEPLAGDDSQGPCEHEDTGVMVTVSLQDNETFCHETTAAATPDVLPCTSPDIASINALQNDEENSILEPSVHIHLRRLAGGDPSSITLARSSLVSQLKGLIANMFHVPQECQSLVLGTVVMDDAKKISEYCADVVDEIPLSVTLVILLDEIRRLMCHEDHAMRIAGLEALAEWTPKDNEDTIDGVCCCLEDPEHEVRISALNVLSKISSQNNMDTSVKVVNLLEHPDHDVKKVAVQAIPEIASRGNPQVIAMISKHLESQNIVTRMAAVEALVQICDKGDEHAACELQARSQHPDKGVRLAAARAQDRLAMEGASPSESNPNLRRPHEIDPLSHRQPGLSEEMRARLARKEKQEHPAAGAPSCGHRFAAGSAFIHPGLRGPSVPGGYPNMGLHPRAVPTPKRKLPAGPDPRLKLCAVGAVKALPRDLLTGRVKD